MCLFVLKKKFLPSLNSMVYHFTKEYKNKLDLRFIEQISIYYYTRDLY